MHFGLLLYYLQSLRRPKLDENIFSELKHFIILRKCFVLLRNPRKPVCLELKGSPALALILHCVHCTCFICRVLIPNTQSFLLPLYKSHGIITKSILMWNISKKYFEIIDSQRTHYSQFSNAALSMFYISKYNFLDFPKNYFFPFYGGSISYLRFLVAFDRIVFYISWDIN